VSTIDPGNVGNVGTEGTIPNTDSGIALGHDPEPSTFEPEEDVPTGDTDGQGMREIAADEQGLAEFGENPDIETSDRDENPRLEGEQ
jgi:hypothetical protein